MNNVPLKTGGGTEDSVGQAGVPPGGGAWEES